MPTTEQKRSPESLLAKIKESEQARLRIYIGAAAGVGKTYQMLEEAHELKRRGADLVLGLLDPLLKCGDGFGGGIHELLGLAQIQQCRHTPALTRLNELQRGPSGVERPLRDL